MTQIIPNGGPRDQEDNYVGLPGEVRGESSNRELRFHDGARPGGFRIPNLDTNDSRYQKRSAELDGLAFKPGATGLLSRLANGVYALRKLVQGDGIAVESNGDSDFVIRMGSELASDFTFKGQLLVKGVAQFESGINADVSGDLSGDSDGLHTGSVKADIDTRGHVLEMDDEQIHMTWVAGLAAALAGATLPIGTIIMWAGALDKIPAGWRLCDGGGGTPSLTGRFARGSAPGNHLAAEDIATHSHVVTSKASGGHVHPATGGGTILDVIHMPAHAHGNGVTNGNTSVYNHGGLPANPAGQKQVVDRDGSATYEGYTTSQGGSQPHSHSVDIQPAGDHTHVNEVGAASHIPPYINLAYIMRIA